MSRAAAPLAMSDGQREVLETLTSSRTAAYRVVQRAQVVLLAADGVSNSEISEVAGVSRPTVLAWRGQFEKDGLVGFGDVAAGRGRKPSISRAVPCAVAATQLPGPPRCDGRESSSCTAGRRARRAGLGASTGDSTRVRRGRRCRSRCSLSVRSWSARGPQTANAAKQQIPSSGHVQ